MAHNEYYTFNQGSVNGKISMSPQVFDAIVKKSVSEMDNVYLDTSKGIKIPGTKAVASCSVKDNEVFINIHVGLKYGVNVSRITKDIQNKISNSILEMTGVNVKNIHIDVDSIIFDKE